MMTVAIAKPPELLTATEAAEYLSLQKQTLDNWRCTGRYPSLKFLRIGRRMVRYRRTDLDEFLAEHIVGGTAVD